MPCGLKLIKEFDFATCVLQHNPKTKELYLSFIRKGHTFFTSTITDASIQFAKRFFSLLDEEEIKDLAKNNIFIL